MSVKTENHHLRGHISYMSCLDKLLIFVSPQQGDFNFSLISILYFIFTYSLLFTSWPEHQSIVHK